MSSFNALVLDEIDGKVTASIKTLGEGDLPEGEVTIAVSHSTLNYKDGLILNGIGRLVRKYPHVPGVDLAGTVEASSSSGVKPGDKVVVTGWRVGELHWGGYAEKARVKADWLVPLPDGMTPARAMAVGTAGFTAMLSVIELERRGMKPDGGEVLVTGAAGGLGSVAVAILGKLGYDVAAVTGRAETHDYLRALGARTIVERAEVAGTPAKPLQSERWAACIDSVGGTMLANVMTRMKYGAAIAVCGNAGGNDLPASVLPLILRGISLVGIESVMKPKSERVAAWSRITRDLPFDKLDAMTSVIGLKDLLEYGARIIKGQVRGRVVVDTRRPV